MSKLICCMKSRDSYNRIVSQFKKHNVEWEDFIHDLEDIQSKIVLIDYDLAVVDEKFLWKYEAVELFERRKVKVIMFQGDFEDILNQLQSYFPDVAEEEFEVNSIPDAEDNKTEKKIEKKVEQEVKYIHVKEPPVYKSVYAGIPNQLVLVIDLSERAGSTFFTLNMAKFLSNLKILNCVVEPPVGKPYIFDTIGMEQRLILRAEGKHDDTEHSSRHNFKYETDIDTIPFYSYPHVIHQNKKLLRDKETIEDGIIWLISDSRRQLICDNKRNEDLKRSLYEAISSGNAENIKKAYEDYQGSLNSWDYYKMMKLMYASKKANIYLVDCGNFWEHESIKPLFSEADMVLVMIDPLPSECMMNEDRLNELLEYKKNGYPIHFVINRWSAGIDKDQLLSYLKLTPSAFLPVIDSKYIYQAIYNYKFPIDYGEVYEQLEKPFYSIVKKFVPKELLNGISDESEKPKLINKVLNKFKFGKKEED